MSKYEPKGATKEPKTKHPTFCNNFTEYLSEYARASSLSGFQYLAEKRSIIERLCWLIAINVSVILSILTVLETYRKWNISPFIMSVEQIPVYQIPWPAVTVCFNKRINQRLYNYYTTNLTEEGYTKLQDISLLCQNPRVNESSRVASSNVFDTISEVEQDFTMEIYKFTLRRRLKNYSFTKMLSEFGICSTFNALDRDEIYTNGTHHHKDFLKHGQYSFGWSLESGYGKGVGLDTYPRRVKVTGRKAGYNIILMTKDPHMDNMCDGFVEGFKIFLHHPGELLGINARYFHVPLDVNVRLAIKPDMIKTSPKLKNYDPHKRGCFFSTEKQLRYYRQYTKENCEMECWTNSTLEKCECVAYYMPHPKGTPICGTGRLKCIEQERNTVMASGIERNRYATSNLASCDCLPACTSLTYNTDFFHSYFNWKPEGAYPGYRASLVEFFFDKNEFTASERNELYGITEFICNCGGILGVFTGFSFLSLVEIFYFLTVRWIVNLMKYGRHHWSASEDLITK